MKIFDFHFSCGKKVLEWKQIYGLVEYCKAQLGKPYWWGTFGQIASETLLNQKKQQYPSQYRAKDFKTQYGKKVHDCSGLIKGYLWCDTPESGFKKGYNILEDCGIVYSSCTEKGTIDTMPEIPGLLVFMPSHVGVYIGNGKVIEARGHAYGVVETNLKDRGWKQWGKCKFIEYVENEEKRVDKEKRCNTLDEVPEWGKSTV